MDSEEVHGSEGSVLTKPMGGQKVWTESISSADDQLNGGEKLNGLAVSANLQLRRKRTQRARRQREAVTLPDSWGPIQQLIYSRLVWTGANSDSVRTDVQR